MRAVEITGVGCTTVGEHWKQSLASLAAGAVADALREAGLNAPHALFVGSAYSGVLGGQENLAAHLCGALGWRDVEGHRVEADGASGSSALRLAELAVAAGAVDSAVVVGVEKVTDRVRPQVEAARASSLDADRDAAMGIGPSAAAGLLMARYLHEFKIERELMGVFPRLAHDHGRTCSHGMLRRPLRADSYVQAAPVAPPLSVLDCAPDADGAAAVVIRAARGSGGVRIAGTSVVTGAPGLAARPDPLRLDCAARSGRQALERAGRTLGEVSLFELDDTTSIQAALSLEALGFVDRGRAVAAAQEGHYGLGGRLPICTFGGNKARGNPLGAAGLYRVVEATRQLRGEAGDNQVRGAKIGLVQSLGGLGSIAITHVLEQ